MNLPLMISAFIAGVLTFLAPCSLPLVPGYLGFISGVSAHDLSNENKRLAARSRVFLNGLFYVFGFSLIFILFGTVFGLGGSLLVEHRVWLSRIGGGFVIFFGLYLMHIFNFKWLGFLNQEKRFNLINKLSPGKPSSSFIFGMTFAFGWTPCIGPVLGTILLLASSTGTVWQGTWLLVVFSIGLALPFLFLALVIGQATYLVRRLNKYLNIISIVGGIFLVFLGILLVTDNFGFFIEKFYQLFGFLNFENYILNYL